MCRSVAFTVSIVVLTGFLAYSPTRLCADELSELRRLQKQVFDLAAAGRHRDAEALEKQIVARAESSFANRPQVIAYFVRNLADLYLKQDRYEDSEPLHRRALAIREQVLGEQHADVAESLSDLASVCSIQGRHSEAEILFKRALAIDEKVFGEQHPNVGSTLNNLALVYTSLARYAEAETLCKRALEIFEKAFGKDHPNVASNLNNLAGIYHRQERYLDAEQNYKRSLAIREKALGTRHPHVAVSLGNLACIYGEQGRDAEAVPLCKRALEIDENFFGDQHPTVAASLNNLANLYLRQRRYSEAEPLYERALSIKRKTYGDQHPNVANTLNHQANLYREQGLHAKAEASYKEVLAISEKAFGVQHPEVANALTSLADLYSTERKISEAEELLDRAMTIYDRTASAPSRRYHSFLLHAQLSWKRGLKNEAVQDLRQAMEFAEQSRHQTSGADKERAEHFSQFSSTFEQMVNWQVELGDAAEALQAIERGRARSLLDEMMRAGTDLNVGRPPRERDAIRQKDSQLRSRVSQLEKQLERASEADRDHLSAALAQARNELYEQYRDERNSSPVYRNLLSTSSGLPRISQLQRTLLASDSLALVYLFGKEGGYVVVLGPQQVRLVPLSVDAASAELFKTSAGPLTSERLRQILVGDDNTGIVPELAARPTSSKLEHQKQMTARLAALWPILIPEAERAAITSGKYKRLIVVPDGPLALFPMETLVIQGEDDPEYLLDNGPPILYGPSLSVLYNLSTRSAPLPLGGQPVLTIADPVYASETTLRNPTSGLPGSSSRFAAAGGSLPRLPFTSEESKAVADAFIKAGMPTGSLERNQATEASVRQFVTGRRIVHLACHGRTDQDHGNFFGALALTPGKQADINPADDGFLTLPEIYELDMKGCELAILSACETNYGPQQQGEGVWTLSRGFLVSGARRVVASNWLVDDEAGARLVSYFCTAVAQDEKQTHQADYASSLQAAKKWTRNQSQWKHPYFWSTFVFVGPK